jgi:hypothetical protein
MKAQNLRIGNWIRVGQGTVEATPSVINSLWENPPKDWIKPIPLTEQWLIEFGFEWYPPLRYWRICINDVIYSVQEHEGFYWLQYVNLGYDESMISCPVKIEYVHQLQNLYHALTGEELIRAPKQ